MHRVVRACTPTCTRSSRSWLTGRHLQTASTPTFPGFTPDLLDTPIAFTAAPPTVFPSPQKLSKSVEEKSKEEAALARYRTVFGSRLAEPEERKRAIEAASREVAGILVPPRPDEPDNCCMSGCVNCVWDVFREDIEEWAAKNKEAKSRLRQQRSKGDEEEASISTEDSAGTLDQGQEDIMEGIPVGIREFMKTEKKLKERHRRGKANG